MYMKKSILIVAISIFAQTVFSQSYVSIKTYTAQDGLSQKNVQSILQDDRGMIWFSTWNGLERFDGYDFENFKTYPDSKVHIANHRFVRLTKSSLDNIWCTSYDQSCYLFDTKSLEYIDIKDIDSRLNHLIVRVIPLNDGVTYLLGSMGEIYRIDENLLPDATAISQISNNGIGGVIHAVYRDKSGSEWILSENGTVRMGSDHLGSLMPFQFVEESGDCLYLATSKGYVACYDMGKDNLHVCLEQGRVPGIDHLNRLEDGRLVLSHAGSNLAILNPEDNSLTFCDFKTGRDLRLLQENDSIVWLMSMQVGVVRLNVKTLVSENIPYERISDNAFNARFRVSFVDEGGRVWLKPLDGELCHYDPLTHKLEQAVIVRDGVETPIVMRTINHLVDNNRNLWYTDENGLAMLSFEKAEYQVIPSHHDVAARGMVEDREGHIWVGWKNNLIDRNGYLSVYDSQGVFLGNYDLKGQLHKDENTLFGTDIYCLSEDADGNIWIGTKREGLFILERLENGTFKMHHYNRTTTDYGLHSKSIFCILHDSHHRVWLGSFGDGLQLADVSGGVGDIRFINGDNRMPGYPYHRCNEIRCLCETDNGVILVGTTNGLVTFSSDFDQPENVQFFLNACSEDPHSLSNNDIYHIMQSSAGDVYVTSYGGGVNKTVKANLLSEHIKFNHYNQVNSTLPDLTMSVVEDDFGHFWATSQNKLIHMDANLNRIEDFNMDGLTDAMPFKLQSGRLLIGGMLNVYCITPDSVSTAPKGSHLAFLYVDILKKDVKRVIISDHSTPLELKSDERNCMITFSALEYSEPNSIEYVYRIKELNEHWMPLGHNHYANLANLPSGNFLFEVRSTDTNGTWNDAIASLPIRVEPKFGETVWAIVLYVLLGLILIAATVWVVLRLARLRRSVETEQELSNIKLRFFTDISHELRTPLTLIANPIEEIERNENLSPEGKENLQVARRNVERMLRLVNQILDVRKIQNGKMKVFVEQVVPGELISRVCDSFKSLAVKQRIQFHTAIDLAGFSIYTDKDKLEKIIFNLLSNAFKYTPEGKSITVHASQDKDTLLLSVEDEGVGISPNRLSTIFSRFETADEADPSISTGIGLSLVKDMLNLMHGSIKVDSKLGEGSRFQMKIPGNKSIFLSDPNVEFILADNPLKGSAETPSVQTKEEPVDESRMRVLIVEDNEELRHFIATILSKDYEVEEADDGKIGLEKTRKLHPDLVISDIMMPNMDGIDYLKSVRTDTSICHIPVILLSAKSSVEDQISGLDFGADDYITKPFHSAYLKAKIAAVLKRRQSLYAYYFGEQGGTRPAEEESASLLDQVSPSMPMLTNYDEDFVNMLVKSVEMNFQNPNFKIEDLTESIHMSRAVFYRKVKSLMGVPPVEFVSRMRIKRAAQLLGQRNLSISEIGYMCGFTTPQYFTKVFRKTMDCTPKEYRERLGAKKITIDI